MYSTCTRVENHRCQPPVLDEVDMHASMGMHVNTSIPCFVPGNLLCTGTMVYHGMYTPTQPVANMANPQHAHAATQLLLQYILQYHIMAYIAILQYSIQYYCMGQNTTTPTTMRAINIYMARSSMHARRILLLLQYYYGHIAIQQQQQLWPYTGSSYIAKKKNCNTSKRLFYLCSCTGSMLPVKY